jgi:hypothetical protein
MNFRTIIKTFLRYRSQILLIIINKYNKNTQNDL